MTMPPGPGGGRGTNGFDVLIQSIETLNSSVQALSADMQRGMDAQERFAPGSGGFTQHGGTLSGRYSPTAGQTQGSTLRSAMREAAVRVLSGAGTSAGGGTYQPTAGMPAAPAGGAPEGSGFIPLAMPVPPMAPPVGGGGPPPPTLPPPSRHRRGRPGGGGGGGGGQPTERQDPPHGGGWVNMGLGLARRVPYVGTAMRIVSAGTDLYLSEREKNRYYQGIEGGSNADGFGERFHEEAYRWSLGMGMSGEMARRSFKGVTALGYTGKDESTNQGRQDALNFVYHNYNTRGMDVEESLGFIQTASKDATVNFQNLSQALKEVSDTAGKAGVNAKLMRQNFEGLLTTSINTGAGPGAANLAGIFSATQASYGRPFQNSDFSGQLATGYQYMLGAQYGVRPGQLQSIMRNRPQEYARMVSGSQRQIIEQQIGPQAIRDIQQLISKYGTTQQAVPIIEQEFLNAHSEIDLNVLSQVLSGPLTGVQLDNSNVMDWIIQQLMGNTAAAHTPDPSASGPVAAKGDTSKATSGKFGLVQPTTSKTDQESKDKSVEYNIKHSGDYHDFFGLHNKESKTGNTYWDQMQQSGQRDPVLEAILQNVKDPDATNVRVSTSTGERIVSLSEAMKYFPNELAKGDVQIVSGSQSGQTISDVVGGNVDASRDTSSELTNPDGAKAGQTVREYETHNYKDYPTNKGNQVSDQKVTVDLTTEARQLLQLLPSLNNQSSATGYPPYNPNSAQGSRP